MNKTDIKVLKHWGQNLKAVKEAMRYLLDNLEKYYPLLVRDLLKEKGFSADGDECAYCSRYFSVGGGCESNNGKCPIFAYTGELQCSYTPWVGVSEHVEPLLHGDNEDAVKDLQSLKWLYKSTRDEFKFLTKIANRKEE